MKAFPFDSHVTYDSEGNPVFDRAVDSSGYRELLKKLFTTGVMPNPSSNMQVSAGTGMTVKISAGFAMVDGCMAYENTDRTLTVSASHSNYNRIDTVVLRFNGNDSVRECDFYIVEGTPSAEPTAPELTRSGSIYEIGLADITIPANSTEISDSRISDTRYNTERCGVVSSISEFDTETLDQQMNAWATEQQTDFAEWSAEQREAFELWVETIKDILDEATAGHLQNEIEDLQEQIDNIKLVHINLTWDSNAVGDSITVANGSESYTFTADSSLAKTIDGMSLGTWTITDTTKNVSMALSTTFYGNYSVILDIGFSVSAWASRGGVTATSLSDISETDMRKLMTLHTCADYLVAKMTQNPSDFTQFASNETAMKWIGLRDYVCDKLMAIAGVKTAMLGSTYWEYILKDHVPVMTGDSAPYGTAFADSVYNSYNAWWSFSGNGGSDGGGWHSTQSTTHYIGYKFTNPICVRRFGYTTGNSEASRIPTKIKLQGSNDNTTWIDVSGDIVPTQEIVHYEEYDVNNSNYYLYYRVYSTYSSNAYTRSKKVQFFGRSLNVSVPTMTSNTAPWGVASTDSTNTSNIPWKAFGNQGQACYRGSFGNYLGYDFGKDVTVRAVSYKFYNDNTYASAMEILGSNNGSTFTKIADLTNSGTALTVAPFANDTAYRYYRVKFTSGPWSEYYVDSFNFFGVDYTERDFAEGSTMKYIYDHGIEFVEIEMLGTATSKGEDYIDTSSAKVSTKQGAYTISTIDLSNYSLMRANIIDVVTGQTASDITTFRVYNSNASQEGYRTIIQSDLPNMPHQDISSINGSKFVGIGDWSTDGVYGGRTKEWWLE